MFKSVRKNNQQQRVSYALILLFIVSQSLATDAGCKMELTGHDMSTTVTIDSIKSHAGHDMQSMTIDSNLHSEMSDCCDLDCQCAQNTCSNSHSMLNYAVHSEFDFNNHSSFFNENKLIHSIVSSALYRPPISC